MYTFGVQLADFLANGHIYFFMLFFVYVWIRWVVVTAFARRYKPFTGKFKTKTSVIIPVVDEPEEIFREVLKKISAQRPHEIIVVINGPKNANLERICARYKKVTCLWTPIAGKRHAVTMGLKNATGEIIALVDSDTIWTKNTLSELVKPFADSTIGGVTTRQKILESNRNLVTQFCAMMEEIRAEGSMKAMSVTGKVGCLPGRTIAFRKSVLDQVIDEFMNERFMGIHKEVSDDRSLTNLTLKAGFKTVAQDTSVVYTDAPLTWKKFIRQQLRWAEGSQYNNLRMFGWMRKNAKLMLFIYMTDIITPIFLVGVIVTYLAQFATGTLNANGMFVDNLLLLVLFSLLGAVASVAVRQAHILRKQPVMFALLPLFIGILTVIMVPVRILGLARCADDLGWGTRESAYDGDSDDDTDSGELALALETE